MAVTTTVLAAPCGLNDQSIQVAGTTGFAVGNMLIVDGEVMSQSAPATGLVVPVRRGGQNGTVQRAHNILAPVTNLLPSDIPPGQPGWATNRALYQPVIVSYGADGAIAPPSVPTIVYLDKLTAAAMTLANPAPGCPDGVEVMIYSNTAAAHVVTYTPGFNQNTTSSDVATFAATSGNSLTIVSARGVWGVKAAAGVVIA